MWTSKSNMAIMEELGSRLKEYRIRKNLQQKELALNAGVGLDTISVWNVDQVSRQRNSFVY